MGSEELAIFEVDREHEALRLVSSRGVDPTPLRRIGLGDGAIGRAAAMGEVQMATAADGEDVPLACVPMRLGEAVAGVIAIFRLLPQKRALGRADQELFELLGTQAAMALHCTRLHARLAHGGNA